MERRRTLPLEACCNKRNDKRNNHNDKDHWHKSAWVRLMYILLEIGWPLKGSGIGTQIEKDKRPRDNRWDNPKETIQCTAWFSKDSVPNQVAQSYQKYKDDQRPKRPA